MDIHGYIHRNSMDMDMDMDRIFHLHGKPDKYTVWLYRKIKYDNCELSIPGT